MNVKKMNKISVLFFGLMILLSCSSEQKQSAEGQESLEQTNEVESQEYAISDSVTNGEKTDVKVEKEQKKQKSFKFRFNGEVFFSTESALRQGVVVKDKNFNKWAVKSSISVTFSSENNLNEQWLAWIETNNVRKMTLDRIHYTFYIAKSNVDLMASYDWIKQQKGVKKAELILTAKTINSPSEI